MSILRVGATDKYSENWAAAFGEKKSAKVKSDKGTTDAKPKATRKKAVAKKSSKSKA